VPSGFAAESFSRRRAASRCAKKTGKPVASKKSSAPSAQARRNQKEAPAIAATGAPKLTFAHASLVALGLMWCLPFLYYRHSLPLTTFYQEWGAAMLGLFAAILLITRRYWENPEIPRIVLLPFGLIMLVLLQFIFGKIGYFSQALLFTSYFLWVALLMMLGQRLRAELGLPILATALAAFLLLGGELSALAALIQHFHWHSILDYVVVVDNHPAVFGNMGQPNHFADYICLGLVSLGLLRTRWQMRIWQVMLFGLPLLFVLVLSGSRSAWVYLLCFVALAFFWQRRDKSCAPLLHYSLALVLGFGLMHLVVQLPLFGGSVNTVTPLGRMLESSSDLVGSSASNVAPATTAAGGMEEKSIRLHIWHEAWLIFTQNPLLGAGMGQFGWQHFVLGPVLKNPIVTGLYNNAHNLMVQTAAEMGLGGLLILLGTLALWVRQVKNSPHTIYHWWGCGLLTVLAIHSLLEYPLWYAYFLGVAALTLGMLDGTTYRLEMRGAGRWSLAAVLLLGTLSMLQMWLGYQRLEHLVATPITSAKEKEQAAAELLEVRNQVLLRPFVEMVLTGFIQARVDNFADVRSLNTSAMHFVPTNSVVYREALLLALAGEKDAAQTQQDRAIWSYPEDYPAHLSQLRSLAQRDPAHFAPLLESAPQTYEEYQLAVRTK
jgi:O-antigen ligase